MKLFLILTPVLLSLACNNAAPVANSNRPINVAQQSNEAKSVLAHTTENQTPKPANAPGGGKWSPGGDPIDTSEFDAKIREAEIALIKSRQSGLKSKDGEAQQQELMRERESALAQAFFARGFALTEARQYASALGDYRRALKLDPDHEESKKWMNQIVTIYSSLKKEPPKEGEEPKPLPFKKEA